MIDYGENGKITEIESDDVDSTVEAILEYVESRFEILGEKNQQANVNALAAEFWEWGAAEIGDEIKFLALPRLKNQ
jgi:hypothetical protein